MQSYFDGQAELEWISKHSKEKQLMECIKCKSNMTELSRERVMLEMDDDVTEGQMADYMAAELSGDFGEWGITEITYECKKCGNVIVVMEDENDEADTIVRDDKKRKTTFDKIGKRLKESVDKVKENEIIEEEDVFENFVPSHSFDVERRVESQKYQDAEKLKQRLLKKYESKELEDVIEGKELKTKKGVCYHIENQDRINLKLINSEHARKKILSYLKLIYGIGDVNEHILKYEGYKTIEDLTEHSRFGFDASKFLELLDKHDTGQIIDWIDHWFSKSHPLVLYSSGLHNKDDFIILDIETMGLFNRPIILFGLAQISGGQILINQYLLRNIEEEPAALIGFLSQINGDHAFITFNGRKFDIPYIRERLAYYRIKGNVEKSHFDILPFSRRAWGERVPNCRLTTLERHLFDIERKDDVPSYLVPGFYKTYMETQNIGPIIPIVEHNKQDLVTLANIFSKLHEEWG